MNNTKWDELRLAMYKLRERSPRFRTKDLTGYLSEWDREWFYHFRGSGYVSIEWVEIEVLSAEQDAVVLALSPNGLSVEGAAALSGPQARSPAD